MRWSGPWKAWRWAPRAPRKLSRPRRLSIAARGPLNADVRCHLRSAVTIGIASLAVAAVVTLWSMLYGALWKFEWSWFYPWALSPYLVLVIVFVAAGNRSKSTQIASVVAGVAVLLFASFLYLDAMLVHVSSTSALVFVFGPLYLLVGGTLVFVTTALVGRKYVGGK